MKHIFYNVGHAETIFIEPDDNTLIVRDFGKNQKKITPYYNNYQKAYNYLTHRLNDGHTTIDAIISHAHADHISGFKKLHKIFFKSSPKRKIFKKSFVPKQDFSSSDTLDSVLLRLSIFGILYCSVNSRMYNRSKNWINFMPIIKDLSHNVIEVCQGDNISHWSKPATVLWPEKTFYIHSWQENKDYEILKRAVLALNTMQSHEVLENIESLERRVINTINETAENSFSNLEIVEESLSIVNNIFRNGNNIKYSPLIFSPRVIRAYKHCVDNDSLVFAFDDDSALYLSDLDGDALNAMMHANPMKNKYSLLKSAHHGTRICARLQNCNFDKIIHCCGATLSTYDGPTIDYNHCNSGNVICLDWDNNAPPQKWDPNVKPLSTIYDPITNPIVVFNTP